MRRMSQLEVRVNRVMDFVRDHLNEDLSLETLAGVAELSRFHFHRIFKQLTTETVNAYVVRQRLERAVKCLRANPQLCLSDVALETGFSSLSDFSRNFKTRYGLNASRWNRVNALRVSKIRQTPATPTGYSSLQMAKIVWQVELKKVAPQTIAFYRVRDPYRGDHLMQGLKTFETYLEAAKVQTCAGLLGMSMDDPQITPLEHCLYDWAVPIEGAMRIKGVGVRQQPAFLTASIAVSGDITQVEAAWEYLYRDWLARSPYLPAHLPAMERYNGHSHEMDGLHWDLECWLPIVEEGDAFV
jgi:AraC family transcriptional regulator